MSRNAILGGLAAALLLAVVGVALVQVWPQLHPEVVESLRPDPDCDLRAAPCASVLSGGGRVRFGIEPRDIPVVQPLQLSVEVEGREVSAVQVDFSGVDMNMGYNRPALTRRAGGRFEGPAMLPVCVRSRMAWEARVLLHTSAGIVAVPYRFETFRPGAGAPR